MSYKCIFAMLNRQIDVIQTSKPLFFLFVIALLHGFVILSIKLIRITAALYRTLTTTSNLKKYYRPGCWAVITGATDGIGLAISKQLYHLNWNLLLVGRNQDKLESLIKSDFSTRQNLVKPFVFDFSKATDDDYNNFSEAIKDKDIGLLINNVGMSHEHPSFFAEMPENILTKMMHVNVISALRMTYIVLPQMLCQNRGLVLNLSSGTMIFPTAPLLSIYAATKSFLTNWSLSLHQEYKSKNIFFEVITPFYVATKLSKVRNTNILIPSPDTYAKSVLNRIGNYRQHCGYVWHDLQCCLVKSIPERLMNRFLINYLLTTRKKALANLAKNK